MKPTDSFIHIGSTTIPLMDYAVGGTAILGIRDSGKTVTAKGIAEQLLDHGVAPIIFDAVGKWRFLKTAGPGERGRAFKIVVAGGRAPDLPLNPHSVGEIVRASIRENIPLIIDLYDPKLSKADWRKVVQQSIRIIHYENVGVRHVFLEEAAEYIPQRVTDGETYAEVEKFARMGGNASVGLTIINQRSQEVNKAVLDLCQNLVLGCQVGSKAIEAVEKWVDRLAPVLATEVTTSLPKLKPGEAWVWTKAQPDRPSRVQIPMCCSLHPDRREPEQSLAARKTADTTAFVQTLNGLLPKIAEEAKANDPGALRAEVRRLQAELAKKRNFANQPSANPAGAVKRVEVPILKNGQIKRLETLAARFETILANCGTVAGKLETVSIGAKESANAIRAAIAAKSAKAVTPLRPASQPVSQPRPQHIAAQINAGQAHPAAKLFDEYGRLDGAQQKILDTIAMLKARGLTPNREMIARWIPPDGIHPNGGRYGSNLAALREAGLMDGCELTADGGLLARPTETGIERAKSVLDGAQQAIIQVLEGGGDFSRETLAEALSIHPNGGRFGSNLARFRTMGLIPERGTIKLTEAAWK